MNAPLPPAATKPDTALNAAVEFFTCSNHLPEAFDRYEAGFAGFRPISNDGSEGEWMECTDYFGVMADLAWALTVDLKNAKLTALSELAKLFDTTLRNVCTGGPKSVKDARASLVSFTNDATRELDVAENAMVGK